MSGEDWRVEVEFEEEEHGSSLGERLRALDLDDEARERLGSRVVVTRDGVRMFLYTSSEQEAAEAARVVDEIARTEGLTARSRTVRWHPVEETWADPSVPLPGSEAEAALEEERRERRELDAAEDRGAYEWQVHVRAPSRSDAAALEQRLRNRGLEVDRRWRFVTVGAATAEEANDLAAELGVESPGAEIWIDSHLDAPAPIFVQLRSWL